MSGSSERDIFVSGIQAQVAAMVDAEQREYGHLRLGSVIDALSKIDPAAVVTIDDEYSPGQLDSYRGYYDQLAFDPLPVDEQRTAAEVLAGCEQANGSAFQGYKGGEYWMTRNTAVWVAPYGDSWQRALTGIDLVDGRVVLRTAERARHQRELWRY